MSLPERTDIHRPGAVEPADYEFIGAKGVEFGGPQGSEDQPYGHFAWARYGEVAGLPFEFVQERIARQVEMAGRAAVLDGVRFADRTWGDGRTEGAMAGCSHCGNTQIVHWSFFVHVPTGEVIAVGQDCATLLELDTREAFASVKTWRREAKGRILKAEREQLSAVWRAEDPRNQQAADHVEAWITAYHAGRERDNDFMFSLAEGLQRFGTLTDNQRDAVLRGIEAKAQRAQLDATLPEPAPCPAHLFDERVEIKGRLVAMKEKDGEFGVTLKMTVVDDRGFKVWSTCPQTIMATVYQKLAAGSKMSEATGDVNRALGTTEVRVGFMCRLRPSDDDPAFVFASRPTKDRVIA
jgi:hypothetical protein